MQNQSQETKEPGISAGTCEYGDLHRKNTFRMCSRSKSMDGNISPLFASTREMRDVLTPVLCVVCITLLSHPFPYRREIAQRAGIVAYSRNMLSTGQIDFPFPVPYESAVAHFRTVLGTGDIIFPFPAASVDRPKLDSQYRSLFKSRYPIDSK